MQAKMQDSTKNELNLISSNWQLNEPAIQAMLT